MDTRARPIPRPLEGVRPRSRRRTLLRPARLLLRVAFGVAGLFLFVLALQLIKTGARAAVPLLDGLDVHQPMNGVGFGWLLAYVALSGSPAAAFGVTLLSGGVLSQSVAFGVIGGSRLGASFIVLAVGFVLYLRKQRNPDGLYIGVISLLTTFTTQGPAIVLGLVSLHYGWLDGLHFSTAPALLEVVDAIYGPPVRALADAFPEWALLLAGLAVLFGSFTVFDRALPTPESEGEGTTRAFRALGRRPFLMFLLGAGVTSLTLSVSISLTILVPLALKGYVKREHVIPYVMGANITTFIDTFAGSVLLGSDAAATVVVTEMLAVAVISLIILAAAYRPYARTILVGADWACRKPRNLALFLGAIVAVPLFLLLI